MRRTATCPRPPAYGGLGATWLDPVSFARVAAYDASLDNCGRCIPHRLCTCAACVRGQSTAMIRPDLSNGPFLSRERTKHELRQPVGWGPARL